MRLGEMGVLPMVGSVIVSKRNGKRNRSKGDWDGSTENFTIKQDGKTDRLIGDWDGSTEDFTISLQRNEASVDPSSASQQRLASCSPWSHTSTATEPSEQAGTGSYIFLRLYNTNISLPPDIDEGLARLTCTFTTAMARSCQNPRETWTSNVGLYLTIYDPRNPNHVCLRVFPFLQVEFSPTTANPTESQVQRTKVANIVLEDRERITALGVYIQPPVNATGGGLLFDPVKETKILTIQSLGLTTASEAAYPPSSRLRIRDVKLTRADLGHGVAVQRRLQWTISCVDTPEARNEETERQEWNSLKVKAESEGVPWSDTTGPFEYFVVNVNGRDMGRAYGLAFPFREGELDAVDTGEPAEKTADGKDCVVEGDEAMDGGWCLINRSGEVEGDGCAGKDLNDGGIKALRDTQSIQIQIMGHLWDGRVVCSETVSIAV